MAVVYSDPAFPRPASVDVRGEGSYAQEGMTLRDYFAGQALVGMFASGGHRGVYEEIAATKQGFCLTPVQIGQEAERQIAGMAYSIADAMIAEREKVY